MISATDQAALRLALAWSPQTEAQTLAKREMISALRGAIEARGERIAVRRSKDQLGPKWTVILTLAYVLLAATAIACRDAIEPTPCTKQGWHTTGRNA